MGATIFGPRAGAFAFAIMTLACAASLLMPAWAQSPDSGQGPPSSASQPIIGPPPSWVREITLPSAPAASSETAPIVMLLQDQQVSLEAGRQVIYNENAIRIQTPAGLAAGNISLPWRPDTEVLTVHKLQIRRGGDVIDVLNRQPFTVVRREQNLESAMLDGVLTANIQPEGLQVGDVLLVAASISTSDPVMRDHVEVVGAAWNTVPIARARLSVQWPETLNVVHRMTPALPQATLSRRAGMVRLELTGENLAPILPPAGAPPRFGIQRLAAFTNFADWADMAALMAPLYDQASSLPEQGDVAAEAARIRALSADPITRAEAALALVQNQVRYVALVMGQGGLVPADAETTWTRRFGDCKAKTALLLALLHALDIEAEPVAVSSLFGDGMNQRLPMISLFDHVLVRATIGGRTYWLDGTRSGDTRLADLQTPNFGWGLPLVAEGAQLVRIQPAALVTPDQRTTVAIDASGGFSGRVPIHAELVFRGDTAIVGNAYYSGLSPAERDSMLREYWRGEFDLAEILSVDVSFDPQSREQRFVMDGRTQMDWSHGRYAPSGVGVGYRADFTREAGPDRDAPFAVAFPYFVQVTQTIRLPTGQGAFRITDGEDVDTTVAGISYRRRARIEGDTFRVELSERSIAPEFPAADAPAAQAALRALADRVINLIRPNTTRAPDLASASRSPTDALPGYGLYRLGMTPDEARSADPNLNPFGPQSGGASMLVSEAPTVFGAINLAPALRFQEGRLVQLSYRGETQVNSADECSLIFSVAVGVLEHAIGPLDGPPANNEYGVLTPTQTLGASKVRFYSVEGGELQRRGHANRRGAHSVEAVAGFLAPTNEPARCRVYINFRDQPLPEAIGEDRGIDPPTPEQLSSARLIETPVFIEQPQFEALGSALPISFTDQVADEVRVLLDCLVIEAGRLNCAITSQEPAAGAYGEAMMRLSRGFQIAPEQDGERTLGAHVQLRLFMSPRMISFGAPTRSSVDSEALRRLAANGPSEAELAQAQPMSQAQLMSELPWLERPDGAAFARYYPVDALERGQEGRVVLGCLVLEDGHLRCAITSEEPVDMQFGVAALGIAQSFRMAPEAGGAATLGRSIVLPISFRLSSELPVGAD